MNHDETIRPVSSPQPVDEEHPFKDITPVIHIEGFAIIDRQMLQDLHPQDALKEIDKVMDTMRKHIVKTRKECKKKKLGGVLKWNMMWHDIFIEYGRWSHIFNKAMRQNIKFHDNIDDAQVLAHKYKYVYAYWWNRYHYTEKALKPYTPNLINKGIVKKIEKAGITISKFIRGDIHAEQLSKRFKQLIENLNATGADTHNRIIEENNGQEDQLINCPLKEINDEIDD